MSGKIEGRAESVEEKRTVVERIFSAWCKVPHLRLGQLILNAFEDPFYIEDEYLADGVEVYAYPRRTGQP